MKTLDGNSPVVPEDRPPATLSAPARHRPRGRPRPPPSRREVTRSLLPTEDDGKDVVLPRRDARARGSGAFYTLVPIRPRWRCERRSLRTFAGVSLRPPLAFNTRPRRLSTPPLTPFNSTPTSLCMERPSDLRAAPNLGRERQSHRAAAIRRDVRQRRRGGDRARDTEEPRRGEETVPRLQGAMRRKGSARPAPTPSTTILPEMLLLSRTDPTPAPAATTRPLVDRPDVHPPARPPQHRIASQPIETLMPLLTGATLRGGKRRPGQDLARALGAFYTLVPIRPRRRGERRSLRTLPGASLRPPLGFNPRPRRLSTSTDAFQLHPDFRLYRTALIPRQDARDDVLLRRGPRGVGGGETASHTTPFAWCTPFLKDFSRRHSSPALPFQRLTGETFD